MACEFSTNTKSPFIEPAFPNLSILRMLGFIGIVHYLCLNVFAQFAAGDVAIPIVITVTTKGFNKFAAKDALVRYFFIGSSGGDKLP